MAGRAQRAIGKPSRRAGAAGDRASAPDPERGRGRASTAGRRRSDPSGPSQGRPPRAASKTTEAARKGTARARGSGRPRPKTSARAGQNGGAPQKDTRRRDAAPGRDGDGLLAHLWRLLRISLRRLERKLKRALATPQARKIMTTLLARRLPWPLRVLVQGLGDPDQRGFAFWWLVVTLVVTLVISVLLSIALAPVVAILALVGVGVWVLIQQARQPAAQRP